MNSRLLNFNRFMSNFSTKLVGGFVPIIVYKYAPSHKMLLAILTCVVQYIFSFVLNLILKNQLVKRPQVYLFLRLFPVILYEVLLLFVDLSPLMCAIGIGIGFSLSYVFKLIPTEVLFAYNNATKKSGTGVQLAFSKLIDQSAMIMGTILGGIALDYWDMRILIIISIILYFIGSFPILVQYFIHKNEKDFNQEYSTYAHMALKEQSYDTEYANNVSLKIRKTYCWFFFLQESYNAVYILMPLLLFTITGRFTDSAIAGALFDGIYGISCLLVGKLEHKKDITKLSTICGVLVGVMAISLIFVKENIIWLFYILISIFAICYAVAYIFMYNRMLMKSKIVGRNTTCVINKINMYFLSTACIVSVGLIAPISICFVVAGGMSIVSGIISPHLEENTRRILVDHLEDNEIKEDHKFKIFRFRKK